MEQANQGYAAQRRARWPAYESLFRVLQEAPVVALGESERLVVSSDLHLGNGGRRDDFRTNAGLYAAVLRDYYLPGGFTLVLNGDIEELLRFQLQTVRRAYAGLFELFGAFARCGRLYKIFGNHDLELSLRQDPFPADRLLEGLRMGFGNDTLLIFHGHQASLFEERCHALSRIALRYAATPLGIKNYTASANSRRRYRVERRVYAFSKNEKILSIIGHTHRPLFASLSKVDTLKFLIERLCREYPAAAPPQKARLAEEILRSKAELERLYRKKAVGDRTGTLYDRQLHVPSLFNAGCAIGRRGFTTIEIREGGIALAHWFDRRRSRRHFDREEAQPERLGDTDYFRVPIDSDQMEYLYTRIRLLT
jgi:UDP-2,3-diacylglucosamine pyrophosphatase LpxH